MRSKDIADRAGVTVRALRHYHRIGLPPEPIRDANGYRRYGIPHLVRLLRIGRLTALGLALGQLPALLEGHDEGRKAILDELDEALAEQIARSEEQRRVVADLRQGGGLIDLSAELATATIPLEAGRADDANRVGREQVVLLDGTLTDEGLRSLAALYGRSASPELAETVRELGQRFDRLGPDSDDAEIRELADAYVRHLGPWMHEYDIVMALHAAGDASALLWAHAAQAVRPEQRRLLGKIGIKLTTGDRSAGQR